MAINNHSKRIVIIGAVAAGTSAAAKARRNDENAEIILYEMDRHISYSGCGLPYYIGGRVKSINELTPRDPAYFKQKYNVDVLIRHQVVSIDPNTKTLKIRRLDDSVEITDFYDTLVLATGAASIVLSQPGFDLPHVFTLRNPLSAMAIRAYIDERKPETAVIIGSGFIGLEMVENLAEAGIRVSLLEKLPNVCPFVDPDLSPYVRQHLEDKGIAVMTGQSAQAITPDSVLLEDGSSLPADLVILAVGIRPKVDLARDAGIKLGPTGAIAVDSQLQTSIADIYACGDCAESFSIVDGQPLYRPLGSTANKMGRIVGDVITGHGLAFRGIAGTGIFKVFDMAVAATGLNESQARAAGFDVIVSHNIKPDKPEYFGGREMVIKTIADRKSLKILGVQIVGYEGVDKRIDVFVTAITAGLLVSDLFHLDLAYAPPFSTTKDPVMYSGMILENAIQQGRDLITAETLAAAEPDSLQIVDARVVSQYDAGHVDRAVSIPHDAVRARLDSLDKNKPVVTYCNKGTTGNAVQNILINKGFKKVYNLSGGHRQYKICKEEKLPPKTD